jgi:hypothetical protein
MKFIVGGATDMLMFSHVISPPPLNHSKHRHRSDYLVVIPLTVVFDCVKKLGAVQTT